MVVRKSELQQADINIMTKKTIYTMKSNLLAIAAVAVFATACSSDGPDSSGEATQIEMTLAVSRAAEQNSLFKYYILEGANKVEPKDENIVISPLTLSMGLTVFANHSDTEHSTKNAENMERLFNVLGTPDLESLNSLATSYVDAIPNLENGTKSDLANLLYCIMPSFKSGEEPDWYAAFCRQDSALYYDILRADIVYGYRKSDDEVIIDDKYKEFFKKYDFDYVNSLDMLQFILFTTLDFEGQWKDKFDKANTRKEVFKGVDGPVAVDMMNQKIGCEVAGDEQMTILKKPFGNGTFEFVAVLPDEGYDIAEIISSGALKKIEELEFSKREIKIGLPKFDIKTGLKDNAPWLEAIGISTNIEVSNVTGIAKECKFKSNIDLRIDEDGAKAEVVSTYKEELIAVQPTSFICNRPFVMMINVAQTGASLITAKIVSMKK